MTDMRKLLRAMFTEARQFLLGEGLRKLGTVQTNARGDVTKEFDYLAEERIINCCAREFPDPVRILTEERGEVRTRPGAARWTLIVDPVDGSENFARGTNSPPCPWRCFPARRYPAPNRSWRRWWGGSSAERSTRRRRGPVRGGTDNPSAVRDHELSDALVTLDFNFGGRDGVSRYRARSLDAASSSPSRIKARRFGTAAFEFARGLRRG